MLPKYKRLKDNKLVFITLSLIRLFRSIIDQLKDFYNIFWPNYLKDLKKELLFKSVYIIIMALVL